MKHNVTRTFLAVMAAALFGFSQWTAYADAPGTGPSVVKLVKSANGFQLTRNGKPYFVKGAGGDASKELLKAIGGNSWRTWGAGGIQNQLDHANQLGMTVTVGMWLGHKEHGFDYHNDDAVQNQYNDCVKYINEYKNDPAVLIWDVGNEMENGQPDDDPAVYKAIEAIAAAAHKLDPNHPTMTTFAEIGGDKVKLLNEYCPDIDILGINSYGGGPSLADRYVKAGGVKPYIITEYGPSGTWEIGRNKWNVALELTSTEKAARYRDTYTKSIADQPLCLGSYAFAWGSKVEATSTWYGLILPDGTKLGGVNTLQEMYTGKPAVHPCPQIASMAVDGADQVDPGADVKVKLAVSSPDGDPIKTEWVVAFDPATYNTGGAAEAAPRTYPDAVIKSDNTEAEIKMPMYKGGYRVYAYVRDTHGGGAVANVPLDIATGQDPPPPSANKATLPFVVYSDAGGPNPYIASGYMGNYAAIKMDDGWAVNPHSGKTCIKVMYSAPDNWGGVIWQNPDNNWGDKAGGWDITGAKKLTFWARGETGAEKVKFLVGIVGSEKTFHDTAKASREVTLTKDWTQYTIALEGDDMTRIVSGFGWTLGGSGAAVTFYLDDIQYE